MTVSAHIETFLNKKIAEFSPEKGISDPTQFATRISVEYDTWSSGKTLVEVLNELAQDPKAAQLTELIIGPYRNQRRWRREYLSLSFHKRAPGKPLYG